uniref:Uncharacterized protein n=1 Tax=Anguilla anguilla TaxID=7936 RepID=A0A0E9TTX2_ANGAN
MFPEDPALRIRTTRLPSPFFIWILIVFVEV